METKSREFQEKIKAISKLIDAGYVTEKSLANMDIEKLLTIHNISVTDLRNFIRIQKSVKKNALYSYLAGKYESEEKTEVNRHEGRDVEI